MKQEKIKIQFFVSDDLSQRILNTCERMAVSRSTLGRLAISSFVKNLEKEEQIIISA